MTPLSPQANDPLQQLRDIHLPEPAGWWPPAPGWWLLALIATVLLFFLLRLSWRTIQRMRWRKRILQHFRHLSERDTQLSNSDFVTEVSRLLRQVALVCYPQTEVASLSGQQWLDFLEQHAHGLVFTRDIGQLLIELPYREFGSPMTDRDKHQLLKLARSWAIQNIRRQPSTVRKRSHAV